MNQIGSIKCIEVPHSGSDKFAEAKKVIILFHGFGADAYDLQTLSQVITASPDCEWIFPQGPLEVPIGPGWTGRAWWKIDMMAIQELAMRGETRDLSSEKPEGLPKSREQVMKMIEQLMRFRGYKWDQIILGGFSQGAMLATEIFISAPEAPRGLMILSGALLDKERWKELAARRSGSSVFMCHGKNDLVLGVRGAQQLETMLTQAGIKTRLLQFDGGHEIPPSMIAPINTYLKQLN